MLSLNNYMNESIKKYKEGSITVETTLVLPIFMFLLINIISLFDMIYMHTLLDTALNNVGRELSVLANYQTAYESDLLTEAYIKTRVIQIVGKDKIDNSVIVGGTQGILLWRTEVKGENDVIDLVMTYRVEPWFPFFQVGDMVMINRCYIKAYTGFEQNKYEEGQRKYYVADTGEVYHLNRSCTHLQLSISMVNAMELEQKRNSDGEKYKPCEVCYDENQSGGNYYIATQGNRYHSSFACTGLKRTIYVIKESNLGNRPMCLRCGAKYG